MDASIHRLCVDQVLDHPAVPEQQKLALRCFLKSWHGRDEKGKWMRSQEGWKQAAALLKISYKALLYKIRQYGIAQTKAHHRLSAGA